MCVRLGHVHRGQEKLWISSPATEQRRRTRHSGSEERSKVARHVGACPEHLATRLRRDVEWAGPSRRGMWVGGEGVRVRPW